MFDIFHTHSGCQFGPLLGLPGGSRCFNRVPRALLVIINWSTAPNSGVEWLYRPNIGQNITPNIDANSFYNLQN